MRWFLILIVVVLTGCASTQTVERRDATVNLEGQVLQSEQE